MFDIGWSEMAVIGVIALIVIGPRDLPRALYTLGRWAGRARGLLRDLQQGMEDIAREAELEEMKKKFDAAKRLDVKREIGSAIDPDGQLAEALNPSDGTSGRVRRSSPDQEEDESHGTIERSPVAPAPPENGSPEEPRADPPARPANPT